MMTLSLTMFGERGVEYYCQIWGVYCHECDVVSEWMALEV